MIKLMDIKELHEEQQSQLIALFERLKKQRVPNLPTQIKQAKEGKGFRFELDVALLNILSERINLDLLTKIYASLLKETKITAE